MNKDSVPATLAIATLVALFCSAIVAGTVYVLRPIQQGYELIDRNARILEAAGQLPAGSVPDREIIERFRTLEAHVVDLASGEYLPRVDGHTYSHWNPSGEQTNAAYAPVYLVRSNGVLERLVLPVHGPGMWNTIQGYIALAADLTTVEDLVFYRHGETPGIGDRIEDASWRAAWRGKRIYDDAGRVRIAVTKQPDPAHGIDLISGASITSDAVGEMVAHWFGDEGYRPFIERLGRPN